MTSEHLHDLDLDRLLLGATPGAPPAGPPHLAGCATCQERLQAKREGAEAFRRLVLPRLERRLHPERRRPVWLAALLALPVAGAFALFAWRGERPGGPRTSIGEKGAGGPVLTAVVRRGTRVFSADAHTALRPGDAVRFVLSEAPGAFLLVASVDGRGKASVYHPYDGARSAPVPAGLPIEAPAGSIVLDDADGPERVFALFSAEPLDAREVRQALEALGRRGPEAVRRTEALPLVGTVQRSLLLEKETMP